LTSKRNPKTPNRTDRWTRNGYWTVDTDYGDYCETGERLWREDRIEALLSQDAHEGPGVLFVRGTTRNQAVFYPAHYQAGYDNAALARQLRILPAAGSRGERIFAAVHRLQIARPGLPATRC
jgi:hypothetical protein